MKGILSLFVEIEIDQCRKFKHYLVGEIEVELFAMTLVLTNENLTIDTLI